MTAVSRPLDDEDDVIAVVADRLWPSIKLWLERKRDVYSEDKCRDDLKYVLTEYFCGFDMAKDLEDAFGWKRVDASLVRLLEKGSELRRFAHKERVRDWVRKIDLRPKYAVGDVVTHGKEPGKIYSVNGVDGTYEYCSDADLQRYSSLITDCVPFEIIDGLNP